MDSVAEWEAWQAREQRLRTQLGGAYVTVQVAAIQTPALPVDPCGVCGAPGVHWPVGSPEPTCCECEHAPGECWQRADEGLQCSADCECVNCEYGREQEDCW